ncbi:hypothetical protein [Saccharopolyspora tripterygii]
MGKEVSREVKVVVSSLPRAALHGVLQAIIALLMRGLRKRFRKAPTMALRTRSTVVGRALFLVRL